MEIDYDKIANAVCNEMERRERVKWGFGTHPGRVDQQLKDLSRCGQNMTPSGYEKQAYHKQAMQRLFF